MQLYNISIFCTNIKIPTFGFLSILRDWRVHREARGHQGAFWSKQCKICVLQQKVSFLRDIINIIKI